MTEAQALTTRKVTSQNAIWGASKKVSILGNSFTATDFSWFYEFVSASGGAFVPWVVAGVAGNTSAQMLARVDSIPSTSDICVIDEGPNDILNAVTSQQHIANYSAICSNLQGRGVEPVIKLCPPLNTRADKVGDYRVAEIWFCMQRGYRFIDPFGRMFDPTTGGWLAGYSGDGTHPTLLKYRDGGTEAIKNITGQAVPAGLTRLANTYTSYVVNGLFIDSSGGLGTGWTLSGPATPAIESGTADGVIGNWQTLSATTQTTLSGVQQNISVPAGSATGASWLVMLRAKATSGNSSFKSGLLLRWLTAGGSLVSDVAVWYGAAGDIPATHVIRRLVQPANAATLRIYAEIRTLDAGAYTGSISIGEVMAVPASYIAGV
jgi:hypothetical protein